jgi:hypothetical protein
MTKIAKIVQSNSHVDYVGRVIDQLDASEPPATSDYEFAQFVSMPLEANAGEVIGVIYNTLLLNPEYGNFGPRLSPRADLKVLSPDYLNEQGVLIGILLLGWREERVENENAATIHHTLPRRVIPVGQDVFRLDDENVRAFHQSAGGTVQLHYYSQIIAHAGAFAVPLIEAIIGQLESACSAADKQRLCVLKKSLIWQRTLGGVRL